MTDQWPVWPRDQLILSDLGSDAPQDKRDSEPALTKGGRVKERSKEIAKRGQVECPRCHEMKTAGLPCPWCSEVGR